MRITNKIMQRNNLSNINTNKIYEDRLSTQMSTEKKINRPSDDPVVAIRALRLRSNVTEITQYYSKNIPDAESWLNVTEDSLTNLSGVLTKMIEQCTTGSNGTSKTSLTTKNRQIILEQLQKLGEEVYSTGDADYAGRYVFTGYRTDTPLSFTTANKTRYEITEQLDSSAVDKVTKVDTGELLNINTSNYGQPPFDQVTDQDISASECYRIRLAYNACSDYTRAAAGAKPTIEFLDTSAGLPGTTVTWTGTDIEVVNSYDKTTLTVTDPATGAQKQVDPYTYASMNDDAIVYLPDTGEVLLGKNRYESLMKAKDIEGSPANEGEIRVTYEKDDWLKGDLRPEHYFACKTFDADNTADASVSYNEDYLDNTAKRQSIEYDIGFNQTIQVNSTADECFNHGIGREVDDIMRAMQDVLKLEAVKTDIESALSNVDENDAQAKKILQNQLEAVEKGLTLAKEKEQRLFEKGITSFQKHLDAANLSLTSCGARSSKLELVKNRTQNQKTTFETLKSENEDIDITEVIVGLTAAELTYNASLMATGKVAQTTLLNYI
ncbi:hypothetical protein D7X48_11225 [bacterium D16-50]|jgi:flagellar hook-associated protein 3 FlgL|nr:hypothetical protein [Lachnospiraceae bacterium]RKJ19911.1 hypothetical protein D7X48_11225 [bacterium D16-50]